MKFFSEIFQDVDGGYSAKRTAFFLLIFLFVVVILAGYFQTIPAPMTAYMQGALDKITELIKWIGGFIAGEQATKFAPNQTKEVGK